LNGVAPVGYMLSVAASIIYCITTTEERFRLIRI